jgi:hypothetical protein
VGVPNFTGGKQMKRAIVILVLLPLTGCVTASGGDFKRFTRHTITQADRQTVEAAVRSRLKDPASAMFGALAAGVTGKGYIVFCGTVNSRNSFGGFAGLQPYAVSLSPAGAVSSVNMSGSDNVDNMLVRSICQNVADAI